MKKVGKPVFFVVALLILALAVVSFTGVYWQYGDITTTYVKGAARDVRWGIDIRGGVDVTFSPPDDYDATPEEMLGAEAVIKQRMVVQNITDYEVYTDTDRDRIIVRFPWRSDEADFDPSRAIEELGETALLTFREGYVLDELGFPKDETADNIILTGSDVERAEYDLNYIDDSGYPSYYVRLTLKESGRQAFADATEKLLPTNGQISIWMDDELVSAPSVNAHITDGISIISAGHINQEGSMTAQEAQDLANKINGGALPFKLITENYSTISPTLGEGARNAMVLAGIIAFVLIAIFMIWQYRLPGTVAVIGLMIAALTGFFPAIPSFTLTLPGIAGVILSIGFGVDANVITAERIKEEIRIGKTIDGAIAAGYKRAFSAIFDGNITVIIVSIILMGAFGPPTSLFAKLLQPVFFMFGPSTAGTIYSFGYTLLTGVLANFVMGIFACRLMQRSICRFKPFRKVWLYGGEK